MEWFSVVNDFVHQAFKVRSKLLLPVGWLKHQVAALCSCCCALWWSGSQKITITCGLTQLPMNTVWGIFSHSMNGRVLRNAHALCVWCTAREIKLCVFSLTFRAAYTHHRDFLNITLFIFLSARDTWRKKKNQAFNSFDWTMCVVL